MTGKDAIHRQICYPAKTVTTACRQIQIFTRPQQRAQSGMIDYLKTDLIKAIFLTCGLLRAWLC